MDLAGVPASLRAALEGLPHSVDDHGLIRVVASELAHAPGETCDVALVGADGAELEGIARAGNGRRAAAGDYEAALWKHVLDTGQPLVLPADPGAADAVPLAPADAWPLLVAPIVVGELAVGVIALSRPSGIPYNSRERAVLAEVCAWLAGRLDDREVRAAVARRRELARVRTDVARDDGDTRFHDVFAQACTPMALTTLEGKMLRANAALEKLLQYPAGALEGNSVTEITLPEDRDLVTAILGLLRAGALSTARFEKRCWTASGTVVSSLLTTSLIRDESGQSLYFFHQVEDLTDRKRVEAALASREAEMRTLFDRSSVGTAAINADGRIRRVNAAFERFVGEPAAALMGRRLSELSHPEDARRAELAVAHAGADPRSHVRFEQRFTDAGGAIHWGIVSVARVADNSMAIVQVVDVTEARRASGERDALLQAFESSGDGIAALDPQGSFVRVNGAFAALFGLAPGEDLAGRHWSEVIPREEQPAVETAMENLSTSGRETLEIRAGRSGPAGPARVLELALVPGDGDSGIARYLFARDVSERARLLAEQRAIADLGQAALERPVP